MARQSSVTAPRRGARFIVRPLFAALAAAGVVAPAHAATINVTTGGDAGTGVTCTLRQAADSLNLASLQGACGIASGAFGTDDTVDLNLQVGTITLATGPIVANTPIMFDGPGAGVLTVSGGGNSQVFFGTQMIVDGLTVANGRSLGFGGCISAEDLVLQDSVVTGCTAASDGISPYPNGMGGGVAAKYMVSYRSSIIGNTANTAGGGAFVIGGVFTQTLVSGNTVAASTCPDVDSEACASSALGGGGILGETVLTLGSTISGNTVNASRFTKYDEVAQQNYFVRVGLGGGISQFPLSLIFGETLGPTGVKSAGVRSSFVRGLAPATRNGPASAAVKAKGAKRAAAGNKVDGQGLEIVGLSHSTVSGNRVTGSGNVDDAKYGGGGALAFSIAYNAEVANSTISGNRLDQQNSVGYSQGGAMITTAVDFSNSTITGNVGNTAVAMQFYGGPGLGAAAKTRVGPAAAKARARLEQLVAKSRSRTKLAGNKAITPPVFHSTILSNVVGDGYEVQCGPGCTIAGANNLIRSVAPGVIVPPDTLTVDPQLAPLANNGGVLAGAPGHPSTTSMPTHLLFAGSPAVNAGNNVEGFEFDQRGSGFPRVVGPAADIGAIEGTAFRNDIPVPALAPWLVAVLSALLGVLGLSRRRRPG